MPYHLVREYARQDVIEPLEIFTKQVPKLKNDGVYETYLKEKVTEFDCQNVENYLSFYEKNAFEEQECRRYLEDTKKIGQLI